MLTSKNPFKSPQFVNLPSLSKIVFACREEGSLMFKAITENWETSRFLIGQADILPFQNLHLKFKIH